MGSAQRFSLRRLNGVRVLPFRVQFPSGSDPEGGCSSWFAWSTLLTRFPGRPSLASLQRPVLNPYYLSVYRLDPCYRPAPLSVHAPSGEGVSHVDEAAGGVVVNEWFTSHLVNESSTNRVVENMPTILLWGWRTTSRATSGVTVIVSGASSSGVITGPPGTGRHRPGGPGSCPCTRGVPGTFGGGVGRCRPSWSSSPGGPAGGASG